MQVIIVTIRVVEKAKTLEPNITDKNLKPNKNIIKEYSWTAVKGIIYLPGELHDSFVESRGRLLSERYRLLVRLNIECQQIKRCFLKFGSFCYITGFCFSSLFTHISFPFYIKWNGYKGKHWPIKPLDIGIFVV